MKLCCGAPCWTQADHHSRCAHFLPRQSVACHAFSKKHIAKRSNWEKSFVETRGRFLNHIAPYFGSFLSMWNRQAFNIHLPRPFNLIWLWKGSSGPDTNSGKPPSWEPPGGTSCLPVVVCKTNRFLGTEVEERDCSKVLSCGMSQWVNSGTAYVRNSMWELGVRVWKGVTSPWHVA